MEYNKRTSLGLLRAHCRHVPLSPLTTIARDCSLDVVLHCGFSLVACHPSDLTEWALTAFFVQLEIGPTFFLHRRNKIFFILKGMAGNLTFSIIRSV